MVSLLVSYYLGLGLVSWWLVVELGLELGLAVELVVVLG